MTTFAEKVIEYDPEDHENIEALFSMFTYEWHTCDRIPHDLHLEKFLGLSIDECQAFVSGKPELIAKTVQKLKYRALLNAMRAEEKIGLE